MSDKVISPALSAKMANMALVSAFLVVAMHAFSMSDSPANGTFIWWVYEIFRMTFTEIAVPYFFLASGYFLARHCDEVGWWKRELGKRVHSLLIPLAIWLLLTIAIRSLGFAVGNLLSHRPLSTGLALPQGYFINAQYFLRSLFVFVALSPIVALAIRHAKSCFILLLFAFYYLLAYFDLINGWTRYFFPVGGFAYFSLGMYLQFKGGIRISRRLRWLLVLAFMIVMAFRISRLQSVLYFNDPFWYASVPLCMFVVWSIMPEGKWPAWLTKTAFPIYLMHAIVYYFLFGIAEVFKHRNFASESLCGYLIAVGIAFGVPVAIANGLRLCSKRIHAIVFGGR